jgi:phosphate:Na+ symporter
MYLLEESLKIFPKGFQLFYNALQRMPFGATGGAIVTGILQSSSMVSFMVLSLWAGVFTMRNAMAIILGTNLERHLTVGW